MKTRSFCGVLLFLLLLLNVEKIGSQNVGDWCSWTGVTINHRITPVIRVMSKMEVRTKDNISDFERFFINAGLGYKILPEWELKGVLAYHRRSSVSKGDFNAYRYHIGSEVSWRKGGFRIQWRERFQHTFALGDGEMIVRSRLKFDYNVPSTILSPYFAVETFNDIESDDFFKAGRIRYTPGMRFKLNGMYSVSVFYCLQDDRIRKSNIAGVEFSINL